MSTSPPAAPPPPTAVPLPAATGTAPRGLNSMDRSLLRGISWTGGVKWASQLLTWASTLVVARILTPEDYGIVGMATVFLGLVTMLGEFGLGAAVVTLRDLDAHQVRQINTLSLVSGVAGALLLCALAIPLGHATGVAALPPVLMVMSVGFVVSAFRTVPEAVLQKEMHFRTLALIEGVQAIAVATATVAFAVAGMGYWTLVAGTLLGTLLSTGTAVARRPHGFAVPRVEAMRQTVTLGCHLLVARLSWYLYSNADFLVVGKLLGERALGAYSFAWSLAGIPIGKISGMIMRVTPAYFSAVSHDPPALRRYLLSITEGLALLTFPATVGLALVAEDFVTLALGEKWRAAVVPLQLLAAYASLRSITPLLSQVLTAVGEARFAMRNNLWAALVLPAAFVLGARWGTAGVATAWMLVHPLVLLPVFRRVFHRLEMGPGAYLVALRPALGGCAVMAAAVLSAQLLLSPLPAWAHFAAQVVAGAAAYGGTVWLLHRERLTAFRASLRAAG